MKQMSDAITKGNENLIKQLQGKPGKLVKPAKVPSWTKSMKLEAYLRALEVWMEMNKDVSEAVRFQEVIEIAKLLKLKYGRTRTEELEELMEEWIKFNFNEHESEEEYLFAMDSD